MDDPFHVVWDAVKRSFEIFETIFERFFWFPREDRFINLDVLAASSCKREDLNAEIEEIHYSSAWCHLGNISYLLGKAYSEDEARAALKNSPEWQMVLDDFHNHTKKNEVDLAKEDVRLGPMLNVDGKSETFTGDTATQQALKLLTREYRKGFEVTQQA